MDYTKNIDLTIDNGKPSPRLWKPSGKKVIVRCKSCAGSVIQYKEDKLYNCKKHKSDLNVCDLVCDDNGVCSKK